MLDKLAEPQEFAPQEYAELLESRLVLGSLLCPITQRGKERANVCFSNFRPVENRAFAVNVALYIYIYIFVCACNVFFFFPSYINNFLKFLSKLTTLSL